MARPRFELRAYLALIRVRLDLGESSTLDQYTALLNVICACYGKIDEPLA
jgi:hypothetical protein